MPTATAILFKYLILKIEIRWIDVSLGMKKALQILDT